VGVIPTLERYCAKCGYKVNLVEDKFCPGCGESIARPEEVILSEEDVKHIPIVEKSPAEEYREKNQKGDPTALWLAGSYYLVIIANGITIILVAIKAINAFFLPLVLLITLFGIALFGAWKLQIEQPDYKQSFIKLMLLALQNFLKHNISPSSSQKPNKRSR